MATARDLAQQSKWSARGPHLAFIGTVILVFGALAFSARILPQDLVTPAVVGLLFALAAIIAVIARTRGRRFAPTHLNYCDVAGALVLIGIGLSTLVEPEQMIRLVEADNRS
jgi:putative Mn2+ efflux pump MntP